VLSPDGKFLYFTQSQPAVGGGSVLMEAYRTSRTYAFGRPRPMPDSALQRMGTQLRRPTGLSSDARALFYWDEVDGQAHVAHRDGVFDPPSNAFSTFAALGAIRSVAPATDCSRIYFTDGAGNLLVAAKQ